MAEMNVANDESKLKSEDKKQRDFVPQNIMPAYSFERALEVAQALCEQFAAKSTEPYLVAQAVNLSPTSNTWRMLSGSAIAYGLTEGGYNAKKITVTPLGKSIIMPISENGEKEKAILECIMKPKILNDFFTRYDRSKLPSKEIGINVLKSMGIPFNRAEKAFSIVVENGKYAGIITDQKTGPFISTTFNESFIKKGSDDSNSITEIENLKSSEMEIALDSADPIPTPHKHAFSKSFLGGNCSINLNIQLQLPETTNPDVYDKLFESMKKHLLE